MSATCACGHPQDRHALRSTPAGEVVKGMGACADCGCARFASGGGPVTEGIRYDPVPGLALYRCPACGGAVLPDGLGLHAEWHGKLESMRLRTVRR